MPGMEIVTVPNKGVRSLQNRCQEWSCFAGLDSSFWKCCPPCFHSELKFGRAIALESWQVSVQTISLLTLTPQGRRREWLGFCSTIFACVETLVQQVADFLTFTLWCSSDFISSSSHRSSGRALKSACHWDTKSCLWSGRRRKCWKFVLKGSKRMRWSSHDMPLTIKFWLWRLFLPNFV